MSCAHQTLEELQEENQFLRRQLGFERVKTDNAKLRMSLGLSEMQMRFALRLYEAKDRVVRYGDLFEAMESQAEDFRGVIVAAWRIRRSLGDRSIATFSALGYMMTPAGRAEFPYLAELTQQGEYRKISETIAREMTRKGIKISAVGDDQDGKGEKVTQLEAAFKAFRVQDVLRLLALHDGEFGRAHLYPDFGNGELVSSDKDQLPLIIDPKTIKKGSLKNLTVIEPMWVYPNDYNASNPRAANFYKPKSWYVMGQRVHATRLLTFISRPMPDLLKPAYAFAGLSLTQMAKRYVDNWVRTQQSVSDAIIADNPFTAADLRFNCQIDLHRAGIEIVCAESQAA